MKELTFGAETFFSFGTLPVRERAGTLRFFENTGEENFEFRHSSSSTFDYSTTKTEERRREGGRGGERGKKRVNLVGSAHPVKPERVGVATGIVTGE